jgi:Tfp pilus assembly protein PilX
MKNVEVNYSESKNAQDRGERGSAIVIALFILALIGVFVALAMSRSSAEAAATGNESAEARTFYAAQASLETMTRNFNKVFEVKLNPTSADLNNVRTKPVPGMDTYTFLQELDQTDAVPGSTVTTLTGGPYTGLVAIQDTWRLRTTATSNNGTTANPIGTQVQLTRNVLNNRIPIFQFGIFYNDDLELFRPPRFSFGGRVHSNGNFFISPGAEGVFFDSRVTAADQIVTQAWRNWDTTDSGNTNTWIKNASGTFVQLLPTMGSVLNTTEGAANNIFQYPPSVPVPAQTPNLDLPPSRLNTSFLSQSSVFDGNLQANTPTLKLPLNVGANTDLVEMLRRGKEIASSSGGDLANVGGTLSPVTAATTDNSILRSERFSNKTGIRISLADRQAKLPGCASGTGTNPVATTTTTKCGIRLDGRPDGMPQEPNVSPTPTATPDRVRGYQPKPMKKLAADSNFTSNPYISTRVNGERFYTGGCTQPTVACREVWIKVETVRTNPGDGSVITQDITEDFLSMGVTEPATQIMNGSTVEFKITDNRWNPGTGTMNSMYDGTVAPTNLTATTPQTPASNGIDSRSVIKLQRFVIPGKPIPTPAATPSRYLTNVDIGAGANSTYNPGFAVVKRFTGTSQTLVQAGCRDTSITGQISSGTVASSCGTTTNTEGGLELTQGTPLTAEVQYTENLAHLKLATLDGVTNNAIVPFPIQMFDAREGLYYDDRSTTYYSNLSNLPVNGIMSMIDIDVANLRRFLRGDFDGLFPVDTRFALSKGGVGMVAADIPVENGWVLYVSDRRGDADFDGEYDMEDIYGGSPGNNGTLELGEDANRNGVLDAKYMDFSGTSPWLDVTGCSSAGTDCEAPRYSHAAPPDYAAVTDTKYYRRGVRLTNGTTLPGIYSAASPANTRGFTVASENGIYVQGNYNTTGAAAPPAQANTPFDQFYPFNSATHIPASIVADGVTILSNSWNDGQSFMSTVVSPYDQSNRIATTTAMRFAMIAGDTIASRAASPNQGGISPRLNGGVHNFKRFLENWSGQRLDYAGSLINLFNSRNNAGAFKCCNEVYNPPIRNWVFDSTFLDPARLPPGPPFFQYVQTTGFLRTND